MFTCRCQMTATNSITKTIAYIKHLFNLVPRDKQSSSSLSLPFFQVSHSNWRWMQAPASIKHTTNFFLYLVCDDAKWTLQIWTTARWNVSYEWTRRLCGVSWKVRDAEFFFRADYFGIGLSLSYVYVTILVCTSMPRA